jgi:hypothetical protein
MLLCIKRSYVGTELRDSVFDFDSVVNIVIHIGMYVDIWSWHIAICIWQLLCATEVLGCYTVGSTVSFSNIRRCCATSTQSVATQSHHLQATCVRFKQFHFRMTQTILWNKCTDSLWRMINMFTQKNVFGTICVTECSVRLIVMWSYETSEDKLYRNWT